MRPSPAALAPVRRTDIPRTADWRQTSSAAAVLQAAQNAAQKGTKS
jgi:hypothetical protein